MLVLVRYPCCCGLVRDLFTAFLLFLLFFFSFIFFPFFFLLLVLCLLFLLFLLSALCLVSLLWLRRSFCLGSSLWLSPRSILFCECFSLFPRSCAPSFSLHHVVLVFVVMPGLCMVRSLLCKCLLIFCVLLVLHRCAHVRAWYCLPVLTAAGSGDRDREEAPSSARALLRPSHMERPRRSQRYEGGN